MVDNSEAVKIIMKRTDQLDFVLNFLSNKHFSMAIDAIHKELVRSKFDVSNIHAIINKLEKDGNLDVSYYKNDKSSNKLYNISFEGLVFLENAPFIFQHKPYRWKANKGTIKTIWEIAKIIIVVLNALAILYLMYMAIPKQ